MAGFIQNIIWNSVEGFVDAAKKTGGEYAGNALVKAGDMIEGGGRSVGGGMFPNSHPSFLIHTLSLNLQRISTCAQVASLRACKTPKRNDTKLTMIVIRY